MATKNKNPPSRRPPGGTDPQKRTRDAEREVAGRSAQRKPAPQGPDQEHDKVGQQVGVDPGEPDLADLSEGITSDLEPAQLDDIDEDDRITQRTEAQRDPDEDRG